MAQFYGVNNTKFTQTNPPTKAQEGEVGGRERLLFDSYSWTAALTTGDLINVCDKIPKGALVTAAKVKVPAFGTSGAIDLGWLASDDGVESAQAQGLIAAGAAVSAGAPTSAAEVGVGKRFAAAVQPQLKINNQGATDPSSGTLYVFIFYVME